MPTPRTIVARIVRIGCPEKVVVVKVADYNYVRAHGSMVNTVIVKLTVHGLTTTDDHR